MQSPFFMFIRKKYGNTALNRSELTGALAVLLTGEFQVMPLYISTSSAESNKGLRIPAIVTADSGRS